MKNNKSKSFFNRAEKLASEFDSFFYVRFYLQLGIEYYHSKRYFTLKQSYSVFVKDLTDSTKYILVTK